MTDPSPRKIEIFAPFGQAFDLTKVILFQPFDLARWCTIGFAAFLAGLADGTHVGGSFNWNGGNGDWKWTSKTFSSGAAEAGGDATMWWVIAGVIALIGLLVLIFIVVAWWAGSRGRFMFIDCIVRNRAAITEPWREYKREGNSLFVFLVVTMFAWMLIIFLLSLPFLVGWLRTHDFSFFGPAYIAYLIAVGCVLVVVGIAWGVIMWFVPPVMYRQRCGPLAALRQVADLVASEPLVFLLYLLFVIVLLVAGGLGSCLVTCLTCCIAVIPYVGTVILLPLYTFYYAYTLMFLRQFGPEFDVWANTVEQPEATPPPPPNELPPPLPA